MRKPKKQQPIDRQRTGDGKVRWYLCSNASECWGRGQIKGCPHKTKHRKTNLCNEEFCSLMKINGLGCVEVTEEAENV